MKIVHKAIYHNYREKNEECKEELNEVKKQHESAKKNIEKERENMSRLEKEKVEEALLRQAMKRENEQEELKNTIQLMREENDVLMTLLSSKENNTNTNMVISNATKPSTNAQWPKLASGDATTMATIVGGAMGTFAVGILCGLGKFDLITHFVFDSNYLHYKELKSQKKKSKTRDLFTQNERLC